VICNWFGHSVERPVAGAAAALPRHATPILARNVDFMSRLPLQNEYMSLSLSTVSLSILSYNGSRAPNFALYNILKKNIKLSSD